MQKFGGSGKGGRFGSVKNRVGGGGEPPGTTILLNHFDGSNGAPPPFTSQVGGAFTTINPGFTLTTAQRIFGTSALAAVDTAGNTIPSASSFNFLAATNYALQLYFRLNAVALSDQASVLALTNAAGTTVWVLFVDGSGDLIFDLNGTPLGTFGPVVADQWHYASLARQDGQVYGHMGTTGLGGGGTASLRFQAANASALNVARVECAATIVSGLGTVWVDEVRVSVDGDRGLGNASPEAIPTAPFAN